MQWNEILSPVSSLSRQKRLAAIAMTIPMAMDLTGWKHTLSSKGGLVAIVRTEYVCTVDTRLG